MSLLICPTDLFQAPAERVWELLTLPRLYPEWADAKVVRAPERPVEPGDRVELGAGPAKALTVIFEIIACRAPEELTIDVRLPFGMINHEVVRITRMAEAQCRVTFN
jgi:hypothetical protein